MARGGDGQVAGIFVNKYSLLKLFNFASMSADVRRDDPVIRPDQQSKGISVSLRMRRPSSSSLPSSYRPLLRSTRDPAADGQREGALLRRLAIRERNRRVFNDNLAFNPLRRPRDRLYHDLPERHRLARCSLLPR